MNASHLANVALWKKNKRIGHTHLIWILYLYILHADHLNENVDVPIATLASTQTGLLQTNTFGALCLILDLWTFGIANNLITHIYDHLINLWQVKG